MPLTVEQLIDVLTPRLTLISIIAQKYIDQKKEKKLINEQQTSSLQIKLKALQVAQQEWNKLKSPPKPIPDLLTKINDFVIALDEDQYFNEISYAIKNNILDVLKKTEQDSRAPQASLALNITNPLKALIFLLEGQCGDMGRVNEIQTSYLALCAFMKTEIEKAQERRQQRATGYREEASRPPPGNEREQPLRSMGSTTATTNYGSIHPVMPNLPPLVVGNPGNIQTSEATPSESSCFKWLNFFSACLRKTDNRSEETPINFSTFSRNMKGMGHP